MSGFTYIFGADYIKNVDNEDDPSVADNDLTTCRQLGHFWANDKENIDYYQYQCFERDPIWGCWTLAFMFVPGLWAGAIWNGLLPQKLVSIRLYTFLWVLTIPFFPLVVLGIKTAGLINPSLEIKKQTNKSD